MRDEGWERRDAPARKLFLAGLVLAGAAALSSLAMYGVLSFFERQARDRFALLPGVERPEPPAPRLQQAPWRDMQALREREERWLSSYGWVDRGAGIAKIPIERALELRAGAPREGRGARP